VRPAASENHRNPVTVSYLSGGDPEDAAEGIRPSAYRSKAGRSSWLRWAVLAHAVRPEAAANIIAFLVATAPHSSAVRSCQPTAP